MLHILTYFSHIFFIVTYIYTFFPYVESYILAFVKYKVNALVFNETLNGLNNRKDLVVKHKVLRFACVKDDPNEVERYGLIDTEQIIEPLWLEEDVEQPGRSWVIDLSNFFL